MITFSEVESSRFKLTIWRGKQNEPDIPELKSVLHEHHPDIIILRLPSENKSTHSELLQLQVPIIHADTLVYYDLKLASYSVPALRNEIQFELVHHNNAHHLASLIPVIFSNYQNHYFSNPAFQEKDILAGYIEWAMQYSQSGTGKLSWYVKKGETLIGFATCSFNATDNICEGILYGVHPEHAGGGIYTDIIRFTQAYFKEQGMGRMLVSTQIQNYAVQKVWVREGFLLKEAFDTYHLNCFQSKYS